MGFVGPVQRVVGVVIIASWMAARAGAQELPPAAPPGGVVNLPAVTLADTNLGEAPQAPQIPPLFPVDDDQPRRPAALMPLYGSLIALQGLDVHSTRQALEAGDGEANPAMRPLAKNSAAFLAVKAGATASVIWVSEKMWKKNRKASIILTTAVNAALAAIVANNYRLNR